MKGTKFTETQPDRQAIVKILKDLDTGKPAPEIVRNHVKSKAELYNWRKKSHNFRNALQKYWLHRLVVVSAS
ncbi:hypothetical protein [Dyadobacter sp. CY356]|uniref:hypothetical protein n=1 Tax=Dyadobacter sp. CY356 TaxID=2906442 RepID=UPI001F2B60DF|nr:hypothetical protein [Dyadobacter sp. CY356]MCF0054768.1 hypothetical protein [Dyadobacter sp. CY356]